VITAEQLAARVRRDHALDARRLEQWLLAENLAEAGPGGLRPTVRGRELGGCL